MKKKIILLIWAALLCGTVQAQATFVHPWMQKRVAYFGDSITDPRNSGSKKKYWNFLQEWLGITPYVYAVSGRQWNDIPRNNGVPIGQWYDEKEEQVMYGHGQPKKLVDRKRRYMNMDGNTYRGRINTAIDKVKRMYPTKQIVLLTPIHRAQFYRSEKNWQCTEDYTNQCGIYLEEYIKAVKEAGNIWAIPVIDMNAISGLYPMMDEYAQFFADPENDRLHPNDKGHERMARTLYYQLSALPCTF